MRVVQLHILWCGICALQAVSGAAGMYMIMADAMPGERLKTDQSTVSVIVPVR